MNWRLTEVRDWGAVGVGLGEAEEVGLGEAEEVGLGEAEEVGLGEVAEVEAALAWESMAGQIQ